VLKSNMYCDGIHLYIMYSDISFRHSCIFWNS